MDETNEHKQMVRALMERVATLDARLAAAEAQQVEIIRLFMDVGARVHELAAARGAE